MLIFPPALRERIRRHGVDTYPDECCGILLGKNADGRSSVVEAIAAGNIAPEATRRKRYDIDPLAILRADKIAAANNLEIVGFYHSHPDHPAVPSDTDNSLAWPDYVYAICSVNADGSWELRAWRMAAADQPLVETAIAAAV